MVKPSAQATAKKRRSKNITNIRNNDVLCGRGGSINAHPGNEHFRQVVQKHKSVYINARFKQEKRLIASSIVSEIRALHPAGRFLAKDARKGTWSDIGDEKACDKTLQALRENAPALRGNLKKEKRKPPQSQKVATVHNPGRNPLGMAQISGAPLGFAVATFPQASIPHAAFLPPSCFQQVPAQPQWPGRYNYYPQVAQQPPPNGARGPLHTAQVGPPSSQPTMPGPLHPPPPLPSASRILQTLPAAAAQTNVAATDDQNRGMGGSKSWRTAFSFPLAHPTEEKQLCDSLKKQEITPSSPQEPSRPMPADAVAGQLASPSEQSRASGVTAAQGNSPSTQPQSNKDISPKARPSTTTVVGTAEPAGHRDSDPSQGLKQTATVQFPPEDRVHKRLRGDFNSNSSHYYQQANGDLPSIEMQTPSSMPPRKVIVRSLVRTSSQDGTATQSVAMPSSSPRRMTTSCGRTRMVAPYSPIKAPEVQATGLQKKQPVTEKKQRDYHKGSSFDSVTQHLLGPWDPDSLGGDGISKMFDSDEMDFSPERLHNKDQVVTQLTPMSRKLEAKPQENIPERSKMDYGSPFSIGTQW